MRLERKGRTENMANAINPIRNAVRSCLRRHRQRDYIRE